jgi:uncharacterized protein YndB with AHSA1/START domain
VNAGDLVARAEVDLQAPPEDVWAALVDPDRIEKYMFGTRVETDWEVGSPITWQGEWEGRKYEDKGEILQFQPHERLRYTHYSPLSGDPDLPENYHTVTIELSGDGGVTTVVLTQDNNPTPEAREHSENNWRTMLEGLKKHVEAAS